MEKDKDLYTQASKMATKVEFLSSSEELSLYAGALYAALMWGREIEERKERIKLTQHDQH